MVEDAPKPFELHKLQDNIVGTMHWFGTLMIEQIWNASASTSLFPYTT